MRACASVCLSVSFPVYVCVVCACCACMRAYILVFGLRDRIRFEIPLICAVQ